MSLKDKLEIGLKPDAPYRPDNLPEAQQDEPQCVEGATPGTDPNVEQARLECDIPEGKPEISKGAKATKTLKPANR